MRHSARWILAALAAAVIPACGGGGGGGGGAVAAKPGGDLDPLFGLTGATLRSGDRIYGSPMIALADETAVYVAGFANFQGGATNTAGQIEKRSLATGALASEFGDHGVLVTNPSASYDWYDTAAQDTEHLYVAMSDSSPGDSQWRIEKRRKDTGALVAGFGGPNGFVTNNPSPGSDSLQHLLVSGTALLAVGTIGGDLHLRIEKRSLATGDHDPAFNGGLPLEFTLFTGEKRVGGVATDGYWLYLAVYPTLADGAWHVCRYSLDSGEFDTAFGVNGFILINPSAGFDTVGGIAVDGGNLYIGGRDYAPGNGQWRIERRSIATQQLDPGFGVQGVVTWNPGSGDDRLLSLQAGAGALFAVGVDSSTGNHRWAIRKLSLGDGSPVAGFGSDGIVSSDPSPWNEEAFSACIADGALFVAGTDASVGTSQWRLERRSVETGALSLQFGSPGTVLRDSDSVGADSYAAMLRIGNHLYAAGIDSTSGASDTQWRIEKREVETGRPVAGFGTFGRILVNPGPGWDEPLAMVEADGWLFIGGTDSSLGQERWRIEKRSLVDGQPDPNFIGGGSFGWDITADHDRLRALLVVGPHLYVAGETTVAGADREWRVAKLLVSDGTLVSEFGTKGHVTHNPSPYWEAVFALATDGVSLYVGGCTGSDAGSGWTVQKRDLLTGALDPAFATFSVNPSPWDDLVRGLAVSDGALYVVGNQFTPATAPGWRIQKLDAATGLPVAAFGTDGAVTVFAGAPAAGTDPRSILVEGGSLYVAGGFVGEWKLEKRSAVKGSLVPTFGTDGVILGGPGSAFALALDADSVYTAGHRSENGNLIGAIEKRTK